VKSHLANFKKQIDGLLAETKQYVFDHAEEIDYSTHLTIKELVTGIENELVSVPSYIEWHPDNYPVISFDKQQKTQAA
jgi:hypothetical protein